MEDQLISVLEEFEYPVFLQGSLSPEIGFPESFFTFWNNSTDGEFASNEEIHTIYRYSVNFYSTDPEKVYSVLREAAKKLKAAGFILSGDGHSLPSGVETHSGRGTEVQFLKNNTITE